MKAAYILLFCSVIGSVLARDLKMMAVRSVSADTQDIVNEVTVAQQTVLTRMMAGLANLRQNSQALLASPTRQQEHGPFVLKVGKAPAQAPRLAAAEPPAQELPALHVEGGSDVVTPPKRVSYAGSSRRVCVSSGIFGMSLCA